MPKTKKDTSGKKPFDPTKSYCNGEDSAGSVLNNCCYRHDKGYSEPNGRSRAEIDKELLDCMKKKGNYVKGYIFYAAVRAGGWYRWNKCREHDKLEAANKKK